VDERALTEKLIAYDTSNSEGIRLAAGFVKGWLEARDIEARQVDVRGLPVTLAELGPSDGPTVLLHGHLDVVPGRPGQFEPRVDGERLIGRGAYDMKGSLAAMLLALHDMRDWAQVRIRMGIVSDEESEEEIERGSDQLVREGFVGDFVITGEPTDMHIGVQAKGVLAMRLAVAGRAAHGATPWLGENAIFKAVGVFRAIESLPFAQQSSELFDRPSINLGRILGGDALNKVPDTCVIDVDIRYLPEQDPSAILEEVREVPGVDVISSFARPPAIVDRDSVFVRTLSDAAAPHLGGEVLSVGRDGASDAVSFLRAGIPAVEFGPVGAGHHGPDEWVAIPSLARYRKALTDFVAGLPERLREAGGTR
jgi:succinyl-diaminopimelate desuccinylase